MTLPSGGRSNGGAELFISLYLFILNPAQCRAIEYVGHENLIKM